MGLSTIESSEAIGDFIRGDSILSEHEDISGYSLMELESAKSELEGEISDVTDFLQDIQLAISRARGHQGELEKVVSEIEERMEEIGEDDDEDGCDICGGFSHATLDCMGVNLA